MLLFFAMCVGAGTFNLLGSLLGGVLMFLLLYRAARWATTVDPHRWSLVGRVQVQFPILR